MGHLANQNYDVCVRKQIDRCVICWSPITTGNIAGPDVGSFGVSSSPDATAAQSSSAVENAVPGCAARTGNAAMNMGSNDFVTIQGGVAHTDAFVMPGGALNDELISIATIGTSNFCGRYFNAADLQAEDATICSRVAPFKLGVNFDGFEQTAAAVADAAAAMAGIQETSSAVDAGAITEPLGTSGFSLGFSQLA